MDVLGLHRKFFLNKWLYKTPNRKQEDKVENAQLYTSKQS